MKSETIEKTAQKEMSYLDLKDIDAFVLDLDGVVTDTAKVHAATWKQTFDEYLQDRANRMGEVFRPFDQENDYLTFVDGKTRYDGVKSFLRSRNISIPYGDPEDPPEKETIYGIGNRKNRNFLKWIEGHGVEPYQSTIGFVRMLRSKGIRFALVSASRNAKKVLRSSGLENLFEVVVDGNSVDELGLRGKPAPDIFLEAARDLGVPPGRCGVVEDALAGVEAGKAGGFAVVVGIDRQGHGEELSKHGADIIVKDLSDLIINGTGEGSQRARLPSALERIKEITDRLQVGVPAILLDYDGTLTPIVQDPSLAVLSEEMRNVLRHLSKSCLVAIVSGRDLEDVRRKVGLDDLAYIGSHGFEMMGPNNSYHDQERGRPFFEVLDQAEKELIDAVKVVNGAWVERKRFAISVHFRMVDERDVPRLERLFDSVNAEHLELRKTGGKRVFELRPNIDWDKGRAVLSLLAKLHINGSRVVPLYIGDDLTDEDAFKAIDGQGITILVSDHAQGTAAEYALNDVGEVQHLLEELVERFEGLGPLGVWKLAYDGFDAEKEMLHESLCAVGNGYFVSRGAAPESTAGETHYPGNYLAGVYNRLESTVDDRPVHNESLVNVPNWLCLSFRNDPGDWFDASKVTIHEHHQELDMRGGTLTRKIIFSDAKNRRTRLEQRRFVSMKSPHIAGLETTITPENWSGNIHLLSALDGRVENTLVKRYRQLNNHHLDQIGNGTVEDETIWLQVETNRSHIRIAEAARTRVFDGNGAIVPKRTLITEPGYIGQEIEVAVEKGQAIRVEKIASIYSSKDRAISESLVEALHDITDSGDFESLYNEHVAFWDRLWDRCQLSVDTSHVRIAQILNLHLFHLLQTVSVHSIDLDVGVPPRGLHGEAYRGLIMWDEIFIFPFLNLRIPDLTRSLLLYRYRRLPRARCAATRAGYAGAMFPWMSGSDGEEAAQSVHLNPMSGRWVIDNTRLEQHIDLAVAYNVWQYYQASGDLDFMSYYGAEMLIEITRFWASKAIYNGSIDRYEILKVMGPDEFHDRYPDAKEPGINNNAYTNVMVTWLICRVLETLKLLPAENRKDLWDSLSLSEEELDHWDEISRKMYVPFHGDGIISQFQRYDELAELDWEGYRKRYGSIRRLDRILEAECDSPNRYKISKQADVLMLFYLLSSNELRQLFDRLGYKMGHETIPKTIDYYMERTSNGSTLGSVVHAWVMSRSDRERSWNMFLEALMSDVSDVQGGTTHEGIHLGAMAGTVDIIQRCYSGMEMREGALWFDPSLPMGLARLRFDIEYRHHRINVEIEKHKLSLTSRPQDIAPILIGFKGEVHPLAPGGTIDFDLE